MRSNSLIRCAGLVLLALALAACDSGAAVPATPTPVPPGATPTAAAPPAATAASATPRDPTAPPATAPAATTHIVVAMGYIPNVQFAPYYVAEDKGYYAAEGLQVEFKYGQVNDLLKVVADGGIDYANVSGDEMVPAVAQSIPVRYIMTQYYRYPISAVAIAGQGPALKTPADLKGHKVGLPGPYGSTYIGLKALLKAGHLAETDIQEQSIGFTQVSALLQRQVEVAMVYSMNEPVQIKNQGQATTELSVADYADLAAVGIATSAKKIGEHPAEVRAFLRATLKGTTDTLADPAGAFASSMKRTPEITGAQADLQRAVLTATLPFLTPPAGRRPGASDPGTWASTESFLREIGLSPRPIDPATLYTNDYLP